jgi:hypothetical protein
MMPDVLLMTEKQHLVLIDEAVTENTLEKLRASLLEAYEAVISYPG